MSRSAIRYLCLTVFISACSGRAPGPAMYVHPTAIRATEDQGAWSRGVIGVSVVIRIPDSLIRSSPPSVLKRGIGYAVFAPSNTGIWQPVSISAKPVWKPGRALSVGFGFGALRWLENDPAFIATRYGINPVPQRVKLATQYPCSSLLATIFITPDGDATFGDLVADGPSADHQTCLDPKTARELHLL